jgi:hypothetical protein
MSLRSKRLTVASLLCCAIVYLMPIFPFVFAYAQQRTSDLSEIKERLVRVEEGQKSLVFRIEELDKRLGSRIDGLEKRMDYVVNLIYVVLAGMFALVGFVLWDRRSALAPAIRRTQDLEEREQKLERAIKEFALKNPEMKEILKNLGLL